MSAPALAVSAELRTARLQGMLAWLDADQSPRFVLLPQAQLQRLATAWNLPTAHGDAP